MAITHTNRKGQVYYLHKGLTKAGKPRYHFSRKPGDDLADAVPDGYEIYEKPSGQVFLRKPVPTDILPEEVEVVKAGLRAAGVRHFVVETEKNAIVVSTPSQTEDDLERFGDALGEGFFAGIRELMIDEVQRQSDFHPMLRFILTNAETRQFWPHRWCFKGSIDGWIPLMNMRGDLAALVARYAPHLGKESFFNLM